MKQDEYSSANQLWNAGATEVQQLNPGGPDQRQTIRSQLNWKFYAGAIIKSEARPTGAQIRKSSKLLTVIGSTTKHAVCRIIFMLYLIPFFTNDYFPKLIRPTIFLNLYTENPQ